MFSFHIKNRDPVCAVQCFSCVYWYLMVAPWVAVREFHSLMSELIFPHRSHKCCDCGANGWLEICLVFTRCRPGGPEPVCHHFYNLYRICIHKLLRRALVIKKYKEKTTCDTLMTSFHHASVSMFMLNIHYTYLHRQQWWLKQELKWSLNWATILDNLSLITTRTCIIVIDVLNGFIAITSSTSLQFVKAHIYVCCIKLRTTK